MFLRPDDGQLFLELMWKLQYFVNLKRRIIRNIAPPDYVHLPGEERMKVRNALWEHPELIDAYVQENPDALPEETLEIVRKWRGFIQGTFFLFRHLKKGSIFIGGEGNQVYSVQGVTQPLEEIMPSEILPQMVQAVLLPFKGCIVYDGLLTSYPVRFGGGIRSNLNRDYSTAKRKERIITTLEEVPEAAAPRQSRKNIAPQVEEVMQGMARLKGDSPLQKSALALAQLGLEVAASDARGSLTEERLRSQERKLRRTATRLLNLLYEEEQIDS